MSNATQIVARNMAVFNAKDIDKLLDNQCPEVEYVLPGGITFRGRDHVKQYVQTFWSAFPDGRLSRIGQVATESEAATEALFTGTHTGPLVTPGGSIAPTGRQVTLRQVFVHRIEGGRIASEHVYVDQLEFLSQLGLAGAHGA
jgi:ketosteroid isomerase-like protein